MRGEKLKFNSNIKLKREIQEYIKPQIIYVPLENKTGITYKHLVKEGEYVFKGDIVAIDEKNNFPLHSSVSGYVITGTKKIMNNGKKIKCVVVENDFKEKYRDKIGSKRSLNNYSKEEFIYLLKNLGITELGGNNSPVYKKYSTSNNLEYLLVNGMEQEPYVECDNAIIDNYTEEILECIDSVLDIMNIKKSYILLKENDAKNIKKFEKYIGTYPNIEIILMPDVYPTWWDKNIILNVFEKKYKSDPSEVGVVISYVSTIYAIYEMLKFNRPLTERIITITGEGIKRPVNVKVKIGALLSEIIENIDGYKNIKNPLFIAGGSMRGICVQSDELVVTKDLNCVMVIEDKEEIKYSCINCGKCSSICPLKLSPVLIMKNIDNKSKIESLRSYNCIECGLCSYICPSKIDVRKYVIDAKEKVNSK